MVSNVEIVEATERDLPAIGGLVQELIESVEDSQWFTLGDARKNLSALLTDPHSFLMVAKEEGMVVGFVNFTRRRTVLHANPSGLIDELIVSQQFRGQGIGRILIAAVLDKCRRLGCSEVEVSTEKANSRAREFYQRCGFEEDAVLLEIHLDVGGLRT